MKSKLILTAILLLLLNTSVLAMDPPVIEWDRTYFPGKYSRFYDVIETSDGGFIAAGFRLNDISSPADTCLFKFDSSGNLQWASETEYYNKSLRKVLQIDGSGYIAIGAVKELPTSSTSLLLLRTDTVGNTLWSQVFEYENASAYGTDFVILPDGGFVVCGRIDPTEGMDRAWILRTDAQGDTLWTREWSHTSWATAVSILYIDGGLTVFAQGNTPTTPGGPHLVRYDMEGNVLWETNFPDWPGTVTPGAQAMCEASDGGLLLLDHYWPVIMHTDYQGNPDWWTCPPGSDQPYGYSVSTTMDGGILYGGELTSIDSKGFCGVIARFDSLGNDLWYDNVYNSGCSEINSVRQLSQGGYIAAGKGSGAGLLIKYAPETGIEEPDPQSLRMEVYPNPFTSVLSVSFNLPEAGEASLTVFDLNGRVVDVLGDGLYSEGEHTLQWAPVGISSGCYLVRLTTADDSVIKNIVLIK